MTDESKCCGTCAWLNTHGRAPRDHRVYPCQYPLESLILPNCLEGFRYMPYARELMKPRDGKKCPMYFPILPLSRFLTDVLCHDENN